MTGRAALRAPAVRFAPAVRRSRAVRSACAASSNDGRTERPRPDCAREGRRQSGRGTLSSGRPLSLATEFQALRAANAPGVEDAALRRSCVGLEDSPRPRLCAGLRLCLCLCHDSHPLPISPDVVCPPLGPSGFRPFGGVKSCASFPVTRNMAMMSGRVRRNSS